MRAAPVLTVLLVCAIATASPAPKPPVPKSRQAQDAYAKAQKAIDAAQAVYNKAVGDAKRTLITDLRAAQKVALNRKDVDEATAIASAIKVLEAEVALLAGLQVTVRADANWQRVMTLPRGMYKVVAAGRWSNDGRKRFGPEGGGFSDGGIRNMGVLQAKVGDRVVDVGASGTISVEADTAELHLRMADSRFDDNTGEVQVGLVRQ